jgi:hypothetical protein
MKSVNLIPAARLSARRRRAHAKRCIAGCSLYAVLAMAAELACRGIWGQADASLPVRLADAQAVVERSARDLAATRADMDAAQSTLRASRSIAEQPDWSVLMNLLALKEGDEIVLRQCLVQPGAPAAASRQDAADKQRESERVREAAARGSKPAARRGQVGQSDAAPLEPSMVLSISGLGRSQPAVSQFVLRLESMHLFARVTLLDTNRETFLGGEALGFRIDCSLDDPAAGAVASTGGLNR